MLPPTPIRRLLLVPLVVVIAGALAALTPAVALLTAAFNLIRRRTRLGRVRRSRLLRVAWLGLVWSAGETAALTVSLCLWLVSGFGGRLDTEPYQARHYAVMKWFLDLIYRAARPRVRAERDGDRPAGSRPAERPPAHRAQPPRRPGRLAAARPLPAQRVRAAPARRHEGHAATRPERGHPGQPGAQRVPAPCRKAGETGSPNEVPLARRRRHRPDPPARGRPGRAQRAGPLPRGRQLDPVPLAPGHRPPPPRAAAPTWPNARPRCPTSCRRTPAARSPRSRPARPRT